MSRFFDRAYVLLLAAAFFWGCGTSQLVLLAVVLQQHGMTPPVIATVLSCLTFGILIAALASGSLASRFGAVHTLLLGAAISTIAIAGLQFALGWSPLTALVMFMRGFGFGLLTPCGQMFTQSRAAPDDRKRLVGIFTAMFLLPTFFGPLLGEWSLARLGESWFFWLALAPLVVALATALCLPRHEDTPAPPDAAGYLTLLRDRRLWLPNLSAAMSGLAFTFANNFLPLMLVLYGIPVGGFFTPFAVVLLITRFLAMQRLQRLTTPHLMMLGLAAYASGLSILAVGNLGAAVFAGAALGLGYGIIVPTAVDWSVSHHPPAERARPVALINMSFCVAGVLATQFTGTALALIGWPGVLAVLGSIVIGVLGLVLLMTTSWRRVTG